MAADSSIFGIADAYVLFGGPSQIPVNRRSALKMAKERNKSDNRVGPETPVVVKAVVGIWVNDKSQPVNTLPIRGDCLY